MPRRCALGCPYDSRISHHQFPHPERNPEGFKAWVGLVGGKLESAEDYEFYRKKVICDIHFKEEDKNRNNRVNFIAVPSLHLHGITGNIALTKVQHMPEIESVSELPSTSQQFLTGITGNIALTKVQHMPEIESVSELPSTSQQTLTGITGNIALTKVQPVPEIESVSELPSTSQQTLTGKVDDVSSTDLPVTERVYDQPSTSRQMLSEHNYCRYQKKIFKKKIKNAPSQLPSLLLEKLKISRRRIKDLQSILIRTRKKNDNFKARLAKADKMSTTVLLKKITKNMTSAAKIFTQMQFNQTHKKPSGRRFSMEEKILSLSMYKRSPKTYTLLAQYFTLPSAKALKRLLAKVEIRDGLNRSVFLKIKETVKDLSLEDRLCTLIFDEMSITPHIHYDCAKDKLKGFTIDNNKFADHALVFMVKGIKKKYKQPVAYYFTNSMKKMQLKNIIKRVIKYVQSTGLKILCTVCDQSTINVSAINDIIADTKATYIREQKEWTHDIMEVGKAKIIPLFDVPHLLKGVRNNLLTKDLKYFDFEENREKTVKWKYYQSIYEADKSYGELKLLQKLTEEHVYVDKIKKMKVKAAAQVFSHSVAVAVEHLTARGDLPEECRDLIKFNKLMDNLFDSLNASSFNVPNGKIYKSCVRKNSCHHELWKTALKVLKTVKFVKKVRVNDKIRLIETKAIPSIKNFLRTIQGIQQLWKILSTRYSFDAMFTRNFNQDPLENFFGNIRSYGVRNTAPNTIAFEGAYKSLLLNNFSSPHSINANCERDENSCLQSLEFFITENKELTSIVPTYYIEEPQFHHKEADEIVVPFINLNTDASDLGQGNYVCGWVLVKCLKNISKSCKYCKKDVHGDPKDKSNNYIRAKEYIPGGKSLLYPTENMRKCFVQIQNIISEVLKKDVPKTDLKKKIKMFTDIFVDFPFRCEIHKKLLRDYFENTLINVLIYSWCRSINRILSGKINYTGDDEVKVAAQLYRNKHKHK